jgi:hypothetical protein
MSGYLVQPVRTPTALRELAEGLRHAHQFLVAAARATVPRLMDLPAVSWGAAAKREHVVLPQLGRPPLVSPGMERHSFIEVVNQCATLERLIDTIVWVETQSDLEGALAVRCNPTTSSAPRKKDTAREDDDHDLVLEVPGRTCCRFQISDVASDKDGNRKEKKDLISLGVTPPDGADVAEWPSGRHFLVVSSEFAKRLRSSSRRGPRPGLFHYVEVKPDGQTKIFEVHAGRAPDRSHVRWQ